MKTTFGNPVDRPKWFYDAPPCCVAGHAFAGLRTCNELVEKSVERIE